MAALPHVVVHVLAKDKAPLLERWLEHHLDQLDYPRHLVTVFLRTNDNTDSTLEIVERWVAQQVVLDPGADPRATPSAWAGIHLDASDVSSELRRYGVHEWNALRFAVLGRLRSEGVAFARSLGAWYFTVDVDNFVRPDTLRRLVAFDRPVVAPFVRYAVGEGESELRLYANFHHPVDARGYFVGSRDYFDLVTGATLGLVEVDLVHCCYLLRPDVLDAATFDDGSGDYEYVVLARGFRALGIPQTLANDAVYGVVTLSENLAAIEAGLADLDRRPRL